MRMGHPVLNLCAQEVTEINTSFIHKLIQDMFTTMDQEGGVGLAAPQIGQSLRMFVYGVSQESASRNDGKTIPLSVLINPILTPLTTDTIEDWESCLSLDTLQGMVPRYTKIHYQGFDATGKKVEGEASDFHARLMQHEYDHLDGILYPQRMTNLKTLGYQDVYEQLYTHKNDA